MHWTSAADTGASSNSIIASISRVHRPPGVLIRLPAAASSQTLYRTKPVCLFMTHIDSPGYFSQFGRVSKVRVSRSKRTTASRGYAFLQFHHPEVAEIAAEAMNGYMMFGQKLQCQVVPLDKQHPALFKGANRKMEKKPWQTIEAERHNKQRTPLQHQTRMKKLHKRSVKRQNAIQACGIEYDAPLANSERAKKQVFD